MIETKVSGISEIKAQLNSLSRDVGDLREILGEDTLPLIYREVRRIFRTEADGRWAPLKASTIARKGHSRILIETRRLFRSLTDREHPDAIVRIDSRSITVGTEVPYVRFHERPFTDTGRRLPPRPILIPIAADTEFAQKLVNSVDRRIQERFNG